MEPAAPSDAEIDRACEYYYAYVAGRAGRARGVPIGDLSPAEADKRLEERHLLPVQWSAGPVFEAVQDALRRIFTGAGSAPERMTRALVSWTAWRLGGNTAAAWLVMSAHMSTRCRDLLSALRGLSGLAGARAGAAAVAGAGAGVGAAPGAPGVALSDESLKSCPDGYPLRGPTPVLLTPAFPHRWAAGCRQSAARPGWAASPTMTFLTPGGGGLRQFIGFGGPRHTRRPPPPRTAGIQVHERMVFSRPPNGPPCVAVRMSVGGTSACPSARLGRLLHVISWGVCRPRPSTCAAANTVGTLGVGEGARPTHTQPSPPRPPGGPAGRGPGGRAHSNSPGISATHPGLARPTLRSA